TRGRTAHGSTSPLQEALVGKRYLRLRISPHTSFALVWFCESCQRLSQAGQADGGSETRVSQHGISLIKPWSNLDAGAGVFTGVVVENPVADVPVPVDLGGQVRFGCAV